MYVNVLGIPKLGQYPVLISSRIIFEPLFSPCSMINFRRCGQHNLILGFQIRVEAGQKDGNQRRATTEKGGKGKARRWEKDDICKRGRNSQIPANLSNDHCYIYIFKLYIYIAHTHIYIHYVLIFIHYNAHIYNNTYIHIIHIISPQRGSASWPEWWKQRDQHQLPRREFNSNIIRKHKNPTSLFTHLTNYVWH